MASLSTMCTNQPHLQNGKGQWTVLTIWLAAPPGPPWPPMLLMLGLPLPLGLPPPLLPGWPPCPPKLPWPPWPPPPCGIYHTECWVNQDLKSVSCFSAFTVCILWQSETCPRLPDASSILISAMLVPHAFNKHQVGKWNIFILLPFDCRFQQLVPPSTLWLFVLVFLIVHVFGSSSLLRKTIARIVPSLWIQTYSMSAFQTLPLHTLISTRHCLDN